MNYTTFRSYRFSQLTLGTVQLGLNYGISNSGGIPDSQESFRMLRYAAEAGINTLDTARQYGHSEQILGDFLTTQPLAQPIHLVSKFKISPGHLSHPNRAWNEVYNSVKQSVDTLKIDKLPVCLLHKGAEPIDAVMKLLPTLLRQLQEEDLIDIGGLSAYCPEDVAASLTENEVEALQIPLNIFDQRLLQNGVLDQLALSSKLVFARSVFLQGLFFMKPDQLSGNLKNAGCHLKRLQKMAEQTHLSIAQLAFSFVRDLPAVNSLVFGAVNEAQIRQNIELLNGPAIPASVRTEMQDVFQQMDEAIITPGLWVL
ncbi:aldo/keto reductase [Larkinella harenae]